MLQWRFFMAQNCLCIACMTRRHSAAALTLCVRMMSAPFRMARVSAVIVALSLSVVGGALLPSFWIAFPRKGFA